MDVHVLEANPVVIKSLRKNLGVDEHDYSQDEIIARMTSAEVLERFLSWHGVQGYGEKLLTVYHVMASSLKEEKISYHLLAAEDNWGIVEALRRRGHFPDYEDSRFDEARFSAYIQDLSLEQAFSEYTAFEGLVNLGPFILQAIQTIKYAE